MARSQIVLVALMFVAVVVIGSVSAAEPPKAAPAKAGAAPAKAGAAPAAADAAADAAGMSPTEGASAPSLEEGSFDDGAATGSPTSATAMGPSGAGGPAGSKSGASDLKASVVVAAGVATIAAGLFY